MALYRALFSVFPFAQPFLQTTRRPTSHIAIAARTPMPPPTYLQRVQQVLSDLAKEHTLTVDYRTFLAKVRPRTLRSSTSVTSTFRAGVRESLVYEVNSGRIAIDTAQTPTTIRFTQAGNAFFTKLALASHPRRRASHPKPPRPSLKVEASKEYLALAAILRSIQTLFAEKTFATSDCYSIPKLSKMVRCYLELEQDLRQENLMLGGHINDLQLELAQMQAALSEQHGVDTYDV